MSKLYLSLMTVIICLCSLQTGYSQCPDSDNDGVCNTEDQCTNFDDDIDIDDDGIPYCIDDCIDVNENGICDDVDTAPITKKLKVHFSLKRGFYNGPIQVTLIPNRPNTTIRYELGTDPSCPSMSSGTAYNGPIQINSQSELQTLKVIARSGNETTKIYTHTYLFNGHNKPTVVFSCSPYSTPSGESDNPMSFEFIVPSGHPLKSVQEYAGTRTSKGGVKAGNSDKIYFRSAYGAGTLKEDLFSDFYYGIKPVNQFDQLFLRADHQDQTRLHQIMSHDALRSTNQLSPAGRYVYFYEFGRLEDVRHLQERPEAGFMEAWTGYDKPNFEAYSGDQHSDLVSSVSGASWAETKRLINIKSFSNFLLSVWIGDAWDFWDNRNYRTAGPTNLNEANGEGLAWHYFPWDLDYGFNTGDGGKWRSDRFQSPEDILDKVEDNIEFRLQFTDVIHCAMYNGGPLTVTNYLDRAQTRFDQLQDFLLPGNSFGIDDDLDDIKRFVNAKIPFLRSELKSNNYYSDLGAVSYSLQEGAVSAGQQLSLSGGSGTIYYTLDGSDVRSESGVLNPAAIRYTGPIALPTGVHDVFARAYNSSASSMVDRWSPTCGFKTYYVDQAYSNVVINEVHYSPMGLVQGLDTISGKNFEFIELKNTGTTPVDLKGARFSKGVDLMIENSLIIPPNGFAVFAEDATVFQTTYGFAPDGQYSGKLDNNGEKINIKDPFGAFIDTLRYDQSDPWDAGADSTGMSLELLHGTLDNDEPMNWFRSDNIGGTPNAENSRTCANPRTGVVINEINYSSNKDQVDAGDWVELHNPTSSAIDLSGWTLYDSGDEYVLPQGTILGPEGYALLVQDEADFTAAFPNVNSSKIIGEFPYKLSGKGERISLFDQNKCLADYVIYNDKAPWPEAPDGEGPSLSLLAPNLDNAMPQSWESSMVMNTSFVNGSPSVSNVCVPGQSCDDGNECTSNDTFDADCNCVGILETTDSDNDGVCDLVDICQGFDDNLIGMPCDDGNECTAGEKYDENCGCSGGVQGDIDNDGLCDALDICDGTLIGTSCEDGDPCTIGERYDASCNCTGGVPADSDNDGVCNEQDLCAGFDDNLLGQLCDDGNPLTDFDMYSAAACGCAGIITDAQVCSKITDGSNDAEETVSTGSVSLISSDLDMTDSYIIGLRFQNINIPNGATITNATIQFGSDETDSEATSITMRTEATDNAAPFTSSSQSISSKTTTAASVTWQPSSWTTTGTSGSAQKTKNIAPIIQAIVNRPGFVAGNAISIIVESTGSRVAESYNTSPTLAAELCISFSTGACQIGYPCDDGNSNTENDVLLADCSCAGTIIPPAFDCVALGKNIGDACNDFNALTQNDVVQANCSCVGTVIPPAFDCVALGKNIGDACNDFNALTQNDVVQANCSCAGTVIPPAFDCVALGANIGDACDDGDINTENDAVQANCTCAGTAIATGLLTTESCNGNTSITYGNGTIKMEGFTDSEYFFQVFTANWQLVFNCGWQCGTSQTVSGLPLGDYRVFIKNSNYQIVCLKDITLGLTASDPDNDNDGVPASEDCNDNDANLTTAGATCNDGDSTTEDDVVLADCTCAGTPVSIGGNTTTETCNGSTSITYGNGGIKMDGLLDSEYFFQVFTSSWQQVYNCGWQCGTSKTVTGLPDGDYRVFIKNSNYQIVCVKDITLGGNTGGGDPDNDGDGVPASQDCNDNDANLTTAGAACDDADATTENDVVQANCSCAGTPIATGGNTGMTTDCGEVAINYGDGTITLEGVAGKQYYFKINDLNNGWAQVGGCSYNCGSQYEKTGLADSKYLITIYNSNWTVYCNKEIVMGASNVNSEASSRTVLKKQKATFNLGLEGIDIFPNPARQELFINLPAQQEERSIKIINSFGQVMKEIHTDQVLEDLMRLDISKLRKGFYYVVIQVKGQKAITKKVVVE